MVVSVDEERVAEALAVVRRYGADCYIHVAERIGALALAGDAAGLRRWQEIAAEIEQLEFGHRH